MERLILGHSMLLRFLRNDEHIKFYESIKEEQAKNIVSILLLREPFDIVKNLLDEERNVNKREKRTVRTKKIREVGLRRSNAILHIKLLVEANMYGTDTELQKAATMLCSQILDKYKLIFKSKQEEQTKQCDRMIAEFLSPACANAVQTLNLSAALNEFITANDSFKDLYASIKKTVKNKGVANIRAVRSNLDVAFTKLTDTIDMLYKINDMGSREAVLQSRLAVIINAINDHIINAATMLSERGLKYGKVPARPKLLPVNSPSAPHKPQE